MAERFVVGNPSCPYNRITTAMNKSTTLETLVDKWVLIAKDLGVPTDMINRIQRKVSQEHWTALMIMHDLLPCWRSVATTKANLAVLLATLENHKLMDLAEEIRKEFSIRSTSFKGKSQLQQNGEEQRPAVNSSNFHDFFLGHVASTLQFGHPANIMSEDVDSAFEITPFAGRNASKIRQPKINMSRPTVEVQPNMSVKSQIDDLGSTSNDLEIENTSSSKHNVVKGDWNAREITPGQYTTVSVKLSKPEIREDDYYKLPGIQKGNGYTLILNIIKYEKQGYRKGAQYDSFMLTQLFTQLGYTVIKYDDPNTFYTKNELEKIVKGFRDHVLPKKPASLVVFIGCHGRAEEIQLSDETFTSVNSVLGQFDTKNCFELEKIPKIFIVESCPDASKNDSEGFGNFSNAILCHALLDGAKEAKDVESGSYYLKFLVKVLAEKANRMSFTELLEFFEGVLFKELIKCGVKGAIGQQPIYQILGNFETLYFNV